MRKSKLVKIGGQDISVYELRVKDIKALQDVITKNPDGLSPLDMAEKILLPVCVPDIKCIDDLSIDDVMLLWDAFKEINNSFLKILKAAMSEDKQSLQRLFLP